MPTTLGTISNTTVKVRWKEPYASESLNRKFTGIVPMGVYRGLILGTSASVLSVDVSPDPTTADHVAVFESETGFTTTYTDDAAGTFTIDLSSYATNDIVVITIFIDYSTGATTTAEFRGFTLAEYDALTDAQRRALIVLGTVLRPAAGVIPAGNITHDRRTLPFLNRSEQSVPWNPLIRNGGFEFGDTNATYKYASPFWKTTVSNANFQVRPVTTEARTGSKSLELTTSVAGIITATIQQDLWMPVTVGRFIMLRLYKKALQAATTSPSGTIRLTFGDLNGTNDVVEDLVFDVDAIDSSFIEVSGIIQVPLTSVVLKSLQIIVAGTYASAAPCIRFDDVQVWAQADAANWLDARDTRAAELATADLFIGAQNAFANNSAKLSFDGTALSVERRDEIRSATTQPPVISVRTRGFNETGNSRYTLLFQSEIPTVSGSVYYRKYGSATGIAIVETINALWTHGSLQWSKDLAGVPATRYDISYNGTTVKGRVADAAWSDGGWIEHLTSLPSDATTFANPQFAPILMARDPGGNRKVIVDHNGLIMGRQGEFRENWWNATPPNTPPPNWTETLVNGYADFDHHVRMNVDPAIGDRYSLRTTNMGFIREPNFSQLTVAEWEWSPNNVSSFLPYCQFAMGFFRGGPVNMVADVGLWIGARETDTNWQFAAVPNSVAVNIWTQAGISGSIINTGIAVSSSTKRMRIEMYGSSLPGGRRALAYINGALVAEIPAASMPLSNLGWGQEIKRISVGGFNLNAGVGEILIRGNRSIVSDDAL